MRNTTQQITFLKAISLPKIAFRKVIFRIKFAFEKVILYICTSIHLPINEIWNKTMFSPC